MSDELNRLIQRDSVRGMQRVVDTMEQVKSLERVAADVDALRNAVSLLQILPAQVGVWSCSQVGESSGGASGSFDRLTDEGDHTFHLTKNGTPTIELDGLIPYASFNGTTDYFNHADATLLDIIGTESIIGSSLNGLTMGGWFWFNASGNNEFLMGKSSAFIGSATGAYKLVKGGAGSLRFAVSDGATEDVTPSAGAGIPGTGQWVFVAGRFDPSTEVRLWRGDADGLVSVVETSSINASIQNTTNDFTIGAVSGGGSYFDGRASLCFLCAAAVSGTHIINLFHHTRALFGV